MRNIENNIYEFSPEYLVAHDIVRRIRSYLDDVETVCEYAEKSLNIHLNIEQGENIREACLTYLSLIDVDGSARVARDMMIREL